MKNITYIINNKTTLFVTEYSVYTGDCLHKIVSGHRLINIHCSKGRNIKPGQPHINNNRNFQRTVIVFEFLCKLVLMVFVSDNLSPFFRIIITGGHYDCNLFRPSRTKLQYTLINFHSDRAGIRNNHRLTSQQVFTVIFVMVENITNKGIDYVIVSKYSFHLSKLMLTFFNNLFIGILSHYVIFFVDQFERSLIKIKFDYTAFVVYRAGSSVLNRLCHIVDINVISEYLTGAAVFGGNRRTSKANICSVR